MKCSEVKRKETKGRGEERQDGWNNKGEERREEVKRKKGKSVSSIVSGQRVCPNPSLLQQKQRTQASALCLCVCVCVCVCVVVGWCVSGWCGWVVWYFGVV